MRITRLVVVMCALGWTGADIALAELVWRPGEGWTDESGNEVSASSSKEQLLMAKELEEAGDLKSAYGAYKGLVRRWPLSFYAPEAQFRVGQIEEKRGEFMPAFKAYQKMIDKYPSSKYFDKALERQFKIGNLYLAGEPNRVWKIPVGPSMDKTIEIYRGVIRNAPYGQWAPQAWFSIGLALEKQKKYTDAVGSYNALIDRYPGSDLVDDAQYQIGYAWLSASSTPEYDQSAAQKSIEAFQDFLVRFPKSEKAAAAEEHIAQLEGTRSSGTFEVARFYQKQGKLKAAEIYFNEVIKASPESDQAKQAEAALREIRGKQAADPKEKKSQ